MSARMSLADLPRKYQDQIAVQMKPSAPRDQAVPAPAKRRLRQRSTPKLNKTEAAFELWLQQGNGGSTIHSQSVTLGLGNGVRYTPDFVVALAPGLVGEGREIMAYEVKGFMRDDAAVKVKVAASLYPWIQFYLVTKAKGGGWQMEEVRQ